MVSLSLSFVSTGPVAAQQAAESETYEYTIQRGDTCARIALRVFGDRRRYDIIHRYNPNMGPTPHQLVPGETLTLPRSLTGPDARVTQVRRRVQARQPTVTEWSSADRGLGLFRGWRVNTLEESSAELTFRDESQVQMRENTLVIIYGGDANATRRVATTRAELQRGTLRSHLGQLRLQVDTPTSQARLDGGAAVVSVDNEGTSRVSNHEGGNVRLQAEAGGTVRVQPGFGSGVRRGQRPTPPRPLPPSPAWVDGATRFAGIASEGGTIRGEWSTVETARIYRVEVRKAGENAAMASAEVPSNVNRFEIHRLPAGAYEVRLSTIDQEFFESRPGDAREVTVALTQLVVPGVEAEQAEPDPSAEVRTPRALAGTQIVAPEGVMCWTEDPAAATSTLTLEGEGEQAIHCRNVEGEELAPFTVDVVRVRVATAEGEAPNITATVGEAQEVRLRLDSPLPLPDALTVDTGDLQVTDARIEDGMWIGTVLAATEGEYPLRITLGDTVITETMLSASEAEAPISIEEPPPETTLPVAQIGQEALGVWRHPSLLGLRDTRPGYHAGNIGIGSGGDAPFGDRSGTRLSLGLEADILGHGRIVVASHPSMAATTEGDGDIYAGGGLHFGNDLLSFYAELAAWFPTSSKSLVRLAPSISLGISPSDSVYIRTRQGALIALEDGARTWASAYGADFRLYGPLFAGVEANLSVGGNQGDTIALFGAGLALGMTSRFARVSAALHRSITDDMRNARGDWVFALSVRIMAPGQSE